MRRLVAIVVVTTAGFGAVVGTALALGGGGGSDVDGTFVLEQPGIFEEPIDEVNGDASGSTMPDVELLDTSGELVTLSAYRGAPLVVNFWFSRCAPCRRELVDFAAVHAEVGDEVQFVGVNPFDTEDAMRRFAEERGVTYDLLRDTGDGSEANLLTNELGLIGYPVTLFVDADGRILRQTGEIDATELRAAIEELF